MSNINSVKIRMYRHGFGDCFLLRFYNGKNLSFKMLIDCGLKHNDSVPGVSVADVVADIRALTSVKKGKKMVPHLDVLVATHEHWDHVSAFKPELKHFDDFDVDRVWLAWTENPEDNVAQQINAHLQDNITALTLATTRIKESTKKKKKEGRLGVAQLHLREQFENSLTDILGFYGPLSATKTTGSGIKVKDNFKVSIETQRAFDHIKTKLGQNGAAITYFEAGKNVIEQNETLPGVRIYVMGPPKNALINKDAPTKGGKEVYFSLAGTDLTGFVGGVLAGSSRIMTGWGTGAPFSNVNITRTEAAQESKLYQQSYFKPDEAWRSINDDWLDVAGQLALQMDNDTNNTSLVLAIEFIESEKVLLFPGDAQVGNWLSWHNNTWKVKNGTATTKVSAADLLERTVFYKAGHHASHNATLKDQGLELMNHEELVVFVPEKENQYNGIPYSPLVKRLNEKAKGRVLFSADKNFPPEKTLRNRPANISAKDWKRFTDSIEVNEKYIEYTVSV